MANKKWFVGHDFHAFADKVLKNCPPEEDPLLANRKPTNRRLPLAGHAFHRANLAAYDGDEPAAMQFWMEFVREWTNQ